ncbi:PKD domain-containing protein [Granulicella tundricola]|uniref:PKD domain-containing protein n=1 Tax=Granulicella tundricola TaxID=940615 RepID=UPI0038CBFD4D
MSFTSAGSSDPGNLALTYTWNFGDGAGAVGAQVTHTYPAGGVFSVTITVFNGTLSNAASTTATIAPATVAPLVANAGGPYTVAVNQPLTVDASKTNSPNGGQLVYAWDFGDGSTASNTPATHTYTAQGTYTLSLAVNDSTGLKNSTTTQVTVGAPAAETITASAGGPYTDVTSHSVTFDASTSFDNLGNPLTFIWDFGDGSAGTGTTPGHAYTNPGTYTVTVTATSGTATAQATAQAVISNSLQVTITSPTANALFGTNTTTITGTISVANLTVTVNGIAAQVSGSSFTATGVSLREGVNLIAATATDGKGGIGTGTVSVIMDATAPTASITSPASGTTVSTSTISVAGMVNDIVTGTVGSNQVTVTVNGVAAQVSNRSFLLPGVLLSPGTNTIKVVVTDLVGNTSQTTSTVQYVQPSAQLSLRVISGDAQTAVVHTILPQPLVIQLLSAQGTPIAGRPITFTVTRSDGLVEVLPNTAQSLYVTTDATGKASILFQLGSRSGLGVNQITASTPGAAGTVLFTESSTLAAPAQIHALHGENQRGLLGQSLAEAFQVIVSDTYGNPVPGTTITYTSTAGDGTLDHASAVTDSNGKASATLTLGQQEGVGNYMVAANFTGNTGVAATFAASAYAPGPASATSVSGVVLDNANTPVPNATVRLLNTNLSTVSDTNGRFSLAGAPVGTVTLSVDGSTSTRTETFPFLSFVLQDLPGQNNTLNKPIYLPSIDINDAQTVGGDDPVTLTMAGVPGVSFTVAPHSVTFPDGTTVGKLSLSQVKSDMVPMAPANGTAPDLIWTLQPAGARFSVPVQVTLPNTRGRAPGAITELYQYDHDLEQFVSAGTGHVSADGSVTMSDPGFGITKAGWGHDYVDPDEDDCPESCDDHNVCTIDNVLPCGCAHTAANGAKCGSNNPNSCQKPGVCDGTHCTGVRSAPGTSCDDGMFCTKNDLCDNNAECHGTKIDDTDNPNAATLLPDGFKIEKAFESGLGPLTSFFNAFGYHVTVAPVIVPEYSVRNSCCEAKQDLLSTQTESKLTLGLTIKTAQIPFPAPYGSISIPLTSYYAGLYIQFGVTISGNMSNKTNDCDDSQCVGGSAGVQVDVEAGLGVNAPGDLRISGGITAGVEVKASIFCHKGNFNVGLTDWKAVFSVGLPGGKTWSFEKVVRTAQQLGNNDIFWFDDTQSQ